MKQKKSGAHTMHGMPAGDTRALVVTGWLTGVYFVIELIIGYWSGSIAVISDAFHTFSAVGGVLIALVAGRLSSRSATFEASFGMLRAEIVGALFNGLFLVVMAIYVLWMSYHRLKSPIEVPSTPMLLAAFGGLVTEFIALSLMLKRSRGNLNMQGALWHVIQTFVGSLTIIVAALVIRYTGFYRIDPILGLLFGVLLLWAGWRITAQTVRVLLEYVPDDFDMREMVNKISALPVVREVHHPHAWSLTDGKTVVSLHVLVEESADCQAVLEEVTVLLKKYFGVYFSTIQVEQRCPDDTGAAAIDVMRQAHVGHD